MTLRISLAAILLSMTVVSALPAEEPSQATPPPSKSYVQPIDVGFLAERFRALPERSRALVGLYLQGAERYVLTREDGVFPDGGTEHWRNIAERAHGAAVLAAIASPWPDDLRQRCRRQSIEFIKEFVAQFRKDPDFGSKRGGSDHGWQSSWWAAEMGTAAWFLWDRLDPSLQQGAADMVVYHADYIASKKPGARVNLDTEAETVAWNSTILSLAANMMPKHPHNARWRAAARQYAYTIFGTSKDARDATSGDDGKPIKDWVVGANIHDDFTLENHGRFHIDYVFTCYRFLIYGAAMHRLGGQPVPGAFRHHTGDVYKEVLLPCTNGGKFAVFVSDNDWKRYHVWTESAAVHGYLALTESSALASALEEQAIKLAASYWREFPKDFSYANPYVCGKAWTPRIADIVLLHLLSSRPPDPIPTAEAESQLRGAHQKRDINLLTHYSREGSFRSVYGGPGPTVRHIEPKANAWMMLPTTANYGVTVDGKRGNDAGANVVSGKGADWFWVVRHGARGEREAFISLPDEVVVMMSTVPGAALTGARTLDSLVSLEKPHRAFTIFYQDGEATYRPGQTTWDRTDKLDGLTLPTRWVNLADSIGYVAVNLSAGSSCMLLPKPGERDVLGLHHVDKPGHDQSFITVALPNRDHHQTAALVPKITGNRVDGVMTCRVPGYFVWANFSDQAKNLKLPQDLESVGLVKCAPNSVGILCRKTQNKTWRPLE